MAKTGAAGNGLPSMTPRGNTTSGVRTRASDPAYAQYNASQKTAREIEDMMDATNQQFQDSSFMQILNAARANNLKPSQGISAAQQAIFNSTGGFDISATSIKHLSEAEQKAIQSEAQRRWNEYSKLTGQDDTLGYASKYYDPKGIEYEGDFGANYSDRYMVAAGLSDIPTSSTNYLRPRTLAAGYDPESQTLTVVFRDGTFWNYYDVPEPTWIQFHTAFSKGPMINRRSKNQAQDGDLLQYKNGPADIGSLSPTAQEFMVRALRTAQLYYGDKSTGRTGSTQRAKQRRNLNTARNRMAIAKNPALGQNLAKRAGGYGKNPKK